MAVALLVAGVAVFALNLRPALVAVGPLTEQLRDDTGLGATAVSLLTTLPLLCFGVFSAVAARLARNVGLEPALMLAGLLLVTGCALRLLPPTLALFVGSAVVGTGIALGNVLVPIVVKRDFPRRTGPMMALYSVMLNAGAALAAGVTVPLGRTLDTGWRATLALWGILALLAVVLWVPQLCRRPQRVGASGAWVPHVAVWRSPVAWAVAGFMGLQSLAFYSLVAWLPTLLQDHGMSEPTSGLMVSIVSIAGIAAAFVVPVVAARRPTQQPLVLLCAGGLLVGLVGLLVAPVAWAVVWMIALGLGTGTGISLAITLFVLRSRTTQGATDLSGMAQAVGYAVAAAGPLSVGALHDLTAGWTAPVIALAVLTGGLVLTGRVAASDRYVEDDGARVT
ncbi:MAG: CynX/NimT family MFS transporter [Solirubrobacteraceae bacterium]